MSMTTNSQLMGLFNQIANQQQGLGGINPFAQAQAPMEEAQTTLLVIGPYTLTRKGEWVNLNRDKRNRVAWHDHQPSRSCLAAAIRWDRQRRPKINARDEFGSLLGVRFFVLSSDYHLRSPIQGTVWESGVLKAEHWDEGEAVRGTCGIHAAWPARGKDVVPDIDAKVEGGLCAKVRGQGKYVLGKEGWRAETVIIDTVYLTPEIAGRWRIRKRLERLYPDVAFEEETWTLERSSRSGKSSRAKSR